MRRPGGQNAPLWSTPRWLDRAFPPCIQMKGEDQPKPVEATQILNDLLVQPILKFQSRYREIPGLGPLHHRTLMGGIDAAGIGGLQDADGTIAETGVRGHVSLFLRSVTQKGPA